ncbi:MAG: helix-turn-helix transcriptional regulator [Candidatus Xenobia bacterium]
MRLRYKARYAQEGEWWIAEIAGVGGGGLATQGKNLAEARAMAADAITQVLLSRLESGEEPDPAASGKLEAGWEWVYPDIRVETALLIRQMRKERRLTMQQAANAIGVTLSTYQRWEDPERCNATVETLDKVARAFGRHVEIAFR